jgi:hypothetical protein
MSAFGDWNALETHSGHFSVALFFAIFAIFCGYSDFPTSEPPNLCAFA